LCISRIAEEIFPFGHYWMRSRRVRKRAESEAILDEAAFAGYAALSVEQLDTRLAEERARASALDEKTFKLTLALTAGLTVTGSVAALLVRSLEAAAAQLAVGGLIGLALFYVLSAGFVAIGALRTLPSHGYGTRFLLQRQGEPGPRLSEALARQETMNTVRHLRNETAYQALRNGLVVLFAALLLFAGIAVEQAVCAL
jgi:hypothetical protein